MLETKDMEKTAKREFCQPTEEEVIERAGPKSGPGLWISRADANKDKPTHYVLGFLFMPDVPSRHNPFLGHEVVLIRKNRPDWQKGQLNGVGGRVEEGETPAEAMVREFSEETGHPYSGWYSVLDMIFPDCVVHVFMLRLGMTISFDKGLTDEPVEVWNVSDVLRYPNKIQNLNWLIPFSLCQAPPMFTPKIFFS